MDCNVQIILFIHEKWGNTSGSTKDIVKSEFHE